MNVQDMLNHLNRMLCVNKKNNFRGIIVISGSKYKKILENVISRYLEVIDRIPEDIKCLYVTEDYYGSFSTRYDEVKKALEERGLKLEKGKYKDSVNYMGRSFDLLILDLYRSLTPDYIGRLIGTVSGGGLIIFLVEDFNKFEEIETFFHQHLLTPPYKIEDVRKLFEKRFKRKILEYENILVIDSEKEEIIKGIKEECNLNEVIPYFRKPLSIPADIKYSEKIYKLCLTEDQVNVLKLLEGLLEEGKKAFLIIADRGRGKSAVLGLSIAALSEYLLDKKRLVDIGITSPSKDNVRTLFEFLRMGLKKCGIEFEEKRNKLIINRKIFIEYRSPLNILGKKYDYLFIDEAAGIGINLLYQYLNKYKKLIFSSTIHGYEGAGRSFSVRFMKYLKERKDFEVLEYKMKEPIRYGENDPIERWLFDTLLLDAEPDELNETDIEMIKEKRVKFYKIPLEEWFEKREDKLRSFVGIYVLAHYQNRPNDLGMIADAPHHDGFVLELESGKIVNAIQVAYEGGIDEDTIERMLKDYKPKGNIIPDVIAKHFREKEFPKLRGIRIVRIATHPSAQGLGLGSIALSNLTEWAKKNKFDWIGTSFGVTYELLNFWLKNGFVIVHLSPEKNKVSGEYSAIVIKPLNKKTEEIVKRLNYEFRWRFINQITDVYFDLEPEVIRKLLETPYEIKPHFDILLTEIQKEKAKAYLKGPMTYEAAADIVRNLFIYYLMYNDKNRPEIADQKMEILIAKILLAWSFRKISDYFDITSGQARKYIKKAAKEIYKWLFG
ncbi:tRNA(Met) cytidine acetyltransferase [Nanoarchaeota archaeon NZ13-N]|nr:MAG: tRNA(Met) cytidine acetyltransferase [Nanoarchaeota archaeon NZ13-N]